MAKVIKREIVYGKYKQVVDIIDTKITYEEAEKVHGEKLDRRRNYAIIEGAVNSSVTYTQVCPGCDDDREYIRSLKGSGCGECGYHGVVRSSMYIPLVLAAEQSVKLHKQHRESK